MDTVPAYRARETDTLFGKSPTRNFLYFEEKSKTETFYTVKEKSKPGPSDSLLSLILKHINIDQTNKSVYAQKQKEPKSTINQQTSQ